MKKIYLLMLAIGQFICASLLAQSTANYSFTTNNTGSLGLDMSGNTLDMSSGTTSLLAAGIDNNRSALTNIGFDFWYMGTRVANFSCTDNGLIELGGNAVTTTTYLISANTTLKLVAPFANDLRVGSDGQVRYKLFGSAPNRVLVVEYSNMMIKYQAVVAAGTGSFQVRFYESTGIIEFVYGAMATNSATQSAVNVGFNTNTTANTFVTVNTSHVANTTGAFAAFTPTASSTVTHLHSTSEGTRRYYRFAPPVPADPGALSFAAVTATGMTLNWTDNATNELGYAIYRSTDGINYTFVTQAAANATSSAQSGLTPSTLYYWKVYAVTEGALNATPASGSQVTAACSLSGTRTVGPTGNYATLTAAITDINANGLAGPLILELQAAYTSASETYPITINAVLCGSFTNTLTIRPETGATGLLISSANTTATIDINGGNYVTIDGRPGGTGTAKELTITNTTTTAPTVRFINEGSNNTVRYCIIRGAASTGTGVVLFSTSSGANGNDNNTISNNEIRENAGGNPLNGIYSAGQSSTITNDNMIISSNSIYNFYSAGSATNGVNVSANSSGWAISGNSFYQTATRNYTSGNTHTGISISTGNGYTINSNYIGGQSPLAAGGAYTNSGAVTSRFVGINFTTSTGTASSIQNNTIANFSWTSSSGASTANGIWCGISITGTGDVNIGNITPNIIGSGTGTGSITTTASTTAALTVGINTSTTGTITIQNNTIGSITANGSTVGVSVSITGIQMTAGNTPVISNNLIGSNATANSINSPTVATSGSQLINGINVSSGVTTATSISNNTVANMNQSGITTGALIRGIIYSGTGFGTLSGNTVHDISGASINTTLSGGATCVQGICYTGTSPAGGTVSLNTVYAILTTNTGAVQTNPTGIGYSNATDGRIFRNKVYDIRNASTMTTATTPPTAIGILLRTGTNSVEVSNNMITLGTGQTTNTEFLGIVNSLAASFTTKIYFNSVHIEGTAASGALPGYAFLRGDNTASSAITTPVDIKNNIFNNTRTGGTGKHYAIGNVNTVPATGWAAGASNNNALNSAVAATVGIWGLAADQTFATWKTASSCDAQSVSGVTVNFVNTASGNLHLNMGVTPTQLESGGTTISGLAIDYDNDVRPGPVGSVNGGGTAPDIGADEIDAVPLDVIAPVITYTTLANTACATDRTFTATITDPSGVNTTTGTKPRLYFKKSVDNNTYAGNTSADNGWKYVEATNSSSPFSFTTNYSLLTGGAANPGDIIQYFVTAQDNVTPTPNVGINSGTFAATPTSVALTATEFPIGGSINSYTILPGIPTVVTIGSLGTYPTLTGAGGLFAAINTNGLIGNTIATILDATVAETGTTALNQTLPGCSGSFTLTIKPAPTVTTVLSGSSATALINLNGADYVTFDGSNNGTTSKDMTIRNTNTSGATFQFINDATNNTIMNTIVEGATSSSTNGTIVFSTAASGVSGNSNNAINNCSVRDRSDAAGVPANAIYSSGTAGITNANNTISNSSLFNFTNGGVTVAATGAGDNWSVSSNNFYQTASRTTAISFISIGGGSGHQVLSNNIGGTATGAGGSNMATSTTFRGISLTVGTTSATSVQGNIIRNIRSTYGGFTASYGIFVTAGLANIGNVSGNYIGSSNVAERVEVNGDSYGIRVSSSSNCTVSNNTVNNMTTAAATVPFGQLYHGIKADGSGGHTITGNTVMNLTNASSDDGSSLDCETFGIFSSATGVQTIRGNTVQNVGNNTTSSTALFNNIIVGLGVSASAAGTLVEKNNIVNIYGTSPTTGSLADIVFGITVFSAASGTYSNNMVSINSSTNTSAIIDGIEDEAGSGSTNNYYYNSVNIYGTAIGSNATYAFERFGLTTVNLRNNIFNNVRTGGTGYHVAMANTNASATGWSATASDYNVVYNVNNAHVTQWQGTAAGNNRTLAAFQASSSGDAHSLNLQPNFVSSTDLHLDATNNCGIDGRATPISITVDYDNQTRDALTPDIGADEITATMSSTPGGIVSTTVCDSRTMNGTTNFSTNACNLLATVLPSGASPVSGTVSTCVYIDPATVPTYNAEPYLQRHIDIVPSTNPLTSTGRVTLYFTDAEFTTFNANNAAFPDLPTAAGGGNSDPNIANLRVSQYHGSPLTSPSSPNQYSAGTAVLINPNDVDVVWNGNYWAVSFDVTGFSGFYIHTNLRFVLPIEVNYFRGSKQGSNHLLNWKVTCNSTPKATLVLERSSSANGGFAPIYSIEATAARCNQPFDYTDAQPLPGMNYYRVKMIDANGKITYSGIVALLNATKGFDIVSIAPNPVVTGSFRLNATAAQASKMDVVIIDMQGRVVKREQVNLAAGFSSTEMNVAGLSSGTYSLYGITADGRSSVLRFVKQ